MAKIGVFSKFEMAGGSEFRCAEIANGIANYSNHESYLLAEKNLPQRIDEYTSDEVNKVDTVFMPDPKNAYLLYEMDILIVVNTDSKTLSHIDYWHGRSERHAQRMDLKRMGSMIFLFNFLVSPSRHLYTIEKEAKDVKIVTTNTKFFEEITKEDRYDFVKHMPRLKVESPIDPNKYEKQKTPSEQIRFGMHSKGDKRKWNEEWPKLIEKCYERLGDRITFDFMGMPSKLGEKISSLPNVKVRKEHEISVSEFMQGIDVFTFFPSWEREEPWARVVGEAMITGCPLLATNKGGNKDQIINHNNGFLCKRTDDFFKNIVYFTENPEYISIMGRNSLGIARNFQTETIINRLLDFALYV